MNLIIQGPAAQAQAVEQLTQLTKASAVERISPQAFRLRGVQPHQPEVAEYCAKAQLDFGYVDANRKLADFGLVVMDMDSTLITIECIDEIADMQGLKPQVAEITAAAMRGEIEFAESLRRRVALLAALDQGALQKVYDERLRLSPGAETMLATLRRNGIKTLLVSGGFTFFTERLKSRLQLDYTAANTLEIVNGVLSGKVLGTIIDAQGKAEWLTRIRDELGLRKEQVIAIGDGANDLKMLAEAGVSIAYHAKPVVRAATSYALNHAGLDGVVNLFE